jgi:uncharacterized membrane protein
MRRDSHGIPLKELAELLQRRPAAAPARPAVRNINQVLDERLTPGQRAADTVANGMGSWRFILIQSGLLVLWIGFNVIGFVARWDAYPFILLNLVMSFQAAYAAPIIMMSQNRQIQKDRLAAEHDYQINVTAEAEITTILRHLEYQDELILQILHRMEHLGTPTDSEAPPTSTTHPEAAVAPRRSTGEIDT